MDNLNIINHGVETIIGIEDIQDRIKAGKKLRIKFGVDPTRPDLTFGHLVVFNKLRQFQDLGHTAILLIGDYTATIGDPSGRSETRPPLTPEEVKENAKTYLDQAFKVLDRDKTELRYNSEWFNKMSFGDCLALARKMTVARMLERDDFSKRFKGNTPISIVEFLYPLVQGYDSVMLEADVELGGNDQLFNLLVGRALQKEWGQPEQAVITMPLLVGLDGVRKMSKSYDNYVSFNDSPKNMFGKIMSISDDAMWPYYKLLLERSDETIEALKQEHPMMVKKRLAVELVSRFHGEAAANQELEEFESVFSKGNLPENMLEFTWDQLIQEGRRDLVSILAATELFPSKKEIRRLVEQGGVKIEGEKADDPAQVFDGEGEVVVQAGKRTYFRVK